MIRPDEVCAQVFVVVMLAVIPVCVVALIVIGVLAAVFQWGGP